MLTEREIELAHPDAFDFAFGNLPDVKQAEFTRHLSRCPHCQKVLDEYSDIGRIIQILPPHVEPSAGLEDRTVAAMVAAMAEQRASTDRPSDADDRAATRIYPIPDRRPPAEAGTRTPPIPKLQPPAGDEARLRQAPIDEPAPAGPQARPIVTRPPRWRRYRGRLAAVVTAAAAIIAAAIVVPLSLGGGPTAVTVAIPLHATPAAKVFGVAAASGQATARQVGESWTFDLSVQGLKPLPGHDVYVCWWDGPGSTKARPLLVTGGSFIVDNSGSATLTMTTGVDPHEFRKMEITAESPGNGALSGPILLTGQSTTS